MEYLPDLATHAFHHLAADRRGESHDQLAHPETYASVPVPLTVWFVASLIAHTGSNHAELIAWLRSPFNAVLMALLLITLLSHTALRLGAVIKDCVHAINQRTIILIVMRVVCLTFALVGIVAVLYIALQVS